MKLQLAAMRLQGVTALHYVLRAVCDSVRRELWGIIQSPECIRDYVATITTRKVDDEHKTKKRTKKMITLKLKDGYDKGVAKLERQ